MRKGVVDMEKDIIQRDFGILDPYDWVYPDGWVDLRDIGTGAI